MDARPDWIRERSALDAYDVAGQTETYTEVINPAKAVKTVVLVDRSPVPRMCILFYAAAGFTGLEFTLYSSGFPQPIPLPIGLSQPQPIVLAPGTSVQVRATGGSGVVEAVVWPDMLWQIRREKLTLLRELAELIKGT